MTRLKTEDICNISSRVEHYNKRLLECTGKSLLGIACYACETDERRIKPVIESFCIHVVPDTSGQGIITGFCETVCAILRFLGFSAVVSEKADLSGVAHAYESRADAFMMADDNRFAGINLKNNCVIDNSRTTGRAFAAALDLMADGVKDHSVLIMGCGPVGAAAAQTVLFWGASVLLYDIYPQAAQSLEQRLLKDSWPGRKIEIQNDLHKGFSKTRLIIEATPSADTIEDDLISDHMVVAAPGVPLGISTAGCSILKNRVIHDKLELGVAVMAVSLVLQEKDLYKREIRSRKQYV